MIHESFSTFVEKAQELGLELLGVIAIAPVTDGRFSNWLATGKQADMHWLERSQEKREDPRFVLPKAKTMIMVTLNYFQGNPPKEIMEDPSRGLIARYAWYQEYHDVLKNKLEQLVDVIKEAYGKNFQYRSYVDTGPVLERYWAEKSGLGFIGKNSNLIFWKYGSYVFLGELLLDVELPEMKQLSIGGCGTCTACMNACPTGAIVAPKVVDARLCISYVTIEKKGNIPEKFRKAMGKRIFGCDICQEVCPWNSKAKKIDGLPSPDWDLWAPKLTDAVLLLAEDFKLRYKNSPVLRTKHRGFIRNVSIALGNWGSPEAKKALERARKKHRDPMIQEHIAWAIVQCGKIEA